jgi:hypothetical protein
MRLNLGAGTPHTHILGYENLDKLTGWLWELPTGTMARIRMSSIRNIPVGKEEHGNS